MSAEAALHAFAETMQTILTVIGCVSLFLVNVWLLNKWLRDRPTDLPADPDEPSWPEIAKFPFKMGWDIITDRKPVSDRMDAAIEAEEQRR